MSTPPAPSLPVLVEPPGCCPFCCDPDVEYTGKTLTIVQDEYTNSWGWTNPPAAVVWVSGRWRHVQGSGVHVGGGFFNVALTITDYTATAGPASGCGRPTAFSVPTTSTWTGLVRVVCTTLPNGTPWYYINNLFSWGSPPVSTDICAGPTWTWVPIVTNYYWTYTHEVFNYGATSDCYAITGFRNLCYHGLFSDAACSSLLFAFTEAGSIQDIEYSYTIA